MYGKGRAKIMKEWNFSGREVKRSGERRKRDPAHCANAPQRRLAESLSASSSMSAPASPNRCPVNSVPNSVRCAGGVGGGGAGKPFFAEVGSSARLENMETRRPASVIVLALSSPEKKLPKPVLVVCGVDEPAVATELGREEGRPVLPYGETRGKGKLDIGIDLRPLLVAADSWEATWSDVALARLATEDARDRGTPAEGRAEGETGRDVKKAGSRVMTTVGEEPVLVRTVYSRDRESSSSSSYTAMESSFAAVRVPRPELARKRLRT